LAYPNFLVIEFLLFRFFIFYILNYTQKYSCAMKLCKVLDNILY
jgi:hypothetical protein